MGAVTTALKDTCGPSTVYGRCEQNVRSKMENLVLARVLVTGPPWLSQNQLVVIFTMFPS